MSSDYRLPQHRDAPTRSLRSVQAMRFGHGFEGIRTNIQIRGSKEISMSHGSSLTILESTFPFKNGVAIGSGGLRDSPSFLGESLRHTG